MKERKQMTKTERDYGCDPINMGEMFKMIPSGDIVTPEEKEKRLRYREGEACQVDCIGLTWEQIATMQGGLNTLDIYTLKP
ncbi:MAG: hypothetical protein U9M89_02750 [Patescibacteria group bacterium]|nr:hypothetical protein [Patescibacteria group bacterium]